MIAELEDTIGPVLQERFTLPQLQALYRVLNQADLGIGPETLARLLDDQPTFAAYLDAVRNYVNRANRRSRIAERTAKLNGPYSSRAWKQSRPSD